jgi:altronate dehydratase small subunit
MAVHGILINAGDNVITLLEDATAGPVTVVGESQIKSLELGEAVERGHKAALCTIPAGGELIKYGIAIGVATQTIEAGQWVHLHNCRSSLDARSSTLDLKTGAPSDTEYS